MTCNLLRTFSMALFLTICFATVANADDAAAQAHVAAAQAAVAPAIPNPDQPFQVFEAFFKQWCAPPKQLPDVVRQENRRIPTSREEWYQPPVRIFDQLYFIGTKGTGVYAINSPDGIAIIDTNFDWDAKDLVLELKDFGLDPQQNLKYIIVTHGHDDRYWGAKSLQETYPKAHVIMSAADWDVLAKSDEPNEIKPKKDMIATDGMKLTLGDTTLTLYLTPGHTPGTISTLVPLKDGNQRHMGAVWGGINPSLVRYRVKYFANWEVTFKTWSASAARFQEIAAKAGADTYLTIHPFYDNALEKIHLVQYRKPGDPHPLVSKDNLNRFLTIIKECTDAQLARITDTPQSTKLNR